MGVKITTNSQAIGADVNEIYFGYYLTNSWKDYDESKRVTTELKLRSAKLQSTEVKDQEGRAKEQAKVTLSWMKTNGYGGKIVKKWWPKQGSGVISKAVGFEVDLDKNPLDVMVKTDKGKFLGLSVKSGKGAGRIPFKNPGLGSIERDLDLKLKHHYKDQITKMLKKFPELPKPNAHRKKVFKKDTEFYENNIQGSKFVQAVFEGIRNDMYDKLGSLTQQQFWDYVKDSWMDAGYLQPPYIIVTGRGTNGKYTATIDDRNELEIQDLTLSKEGRDKIRILSKGNKLLDMRVKFESQHMATSIKFSGE